ncbi:MAG: PKD domain-containing protein [Bacteroidota bacterium]
MSDNLRRYIILGALGAVLIIAVLISFNMAYRSGIANLDFIISDQNANFSYEVDEEITFSLVDSISFLNRQITWYFGDGKSWRNATNVKHKFNESGTYLITLQIDGKFKVDKYIDVIEFKKNAAIDSVARVFAPSKAYVKEEIIFRSTSIGAKSWFWEFGETGFVDSYDAHTVYIYETPGNYTVSLRTNLAQYPTYHRIQILPQFSIVDIEKTDSLSRIEQDVKERLQAISDAEHSNTRAFYQNLNHIIKNYITCYEPEEIVIIINDTKYNDLYSYCQGLHFLGRKDAKSVLVDLVKVDTLKCRNKTNITQISVTQSFRN